MAPPKRTSMKATAETRDSQDTQLFVQGMLEQMVRKDFVFWRNLLAEKEKIVSHHCRLGCRL